MIIQSFIIFKKNNYFVGKKVKPSSLKDSDKDYSLFIIVFFLLKKIK